jgi:sugar phosphate isomerase/epimerase
MRLGLEAGEYTHELAKRLGIKGVPVSVNELVEKGPEDAVEPLRKKGLEICQIGAVGYNPLGPDKEAAKAQRSLIEKAIPMAAAVGCPLIAISCGSYASSPYGGFSPDNFTDRAIDDMAKALDPLLSSADAHGAVISIEAYIKGVVNTPESFDKLFTRCGSSALKINLDITSQYDLLDLIDPRPLCAAAIPKFKGKTGIVHIKGIALEEGFHIKAGLAPITEDPTDWELVLEETAKVVDDGTWVLLEHVLSEEEGEKSVSHLRDIASRLGINLF